MEYSSITHLLRDQHKTIRGLLAQSEASPVRAPSMQNGVEHELFDEIELHCLIEERTLYRELRKSPDAIIRVKSDASFLHHAELEAAVGEARDLLRKSRHSELRDQIETIRSLFDIHVMEEEGEIFVMADRTLGVSLLRTMVEEAGQIREEFLAEDKRSSYLPERVQNPRGGEQMRKVA